MEQKTTNYDNTPYIVPGYILHEIARYMHGMDKALKKLGIDPDTGSVEILQLAQDIINDINADQSPIDLTTLPTIKL